MAGAAEKLAAKRAQAQATAAPTDKPMGTASVPRRQTATKPAGKAETAEPTKKGPSEAQLAARARFAEASKARAAAKAAEAAGETEAPAKATKATKPTKVAGRPTEARREANRKPKAEKAAEPVQMSDYARRKAAKAERDAEAAAQAKKDEAKAKRAATRAANKGETAPAAKPAAKASKATKPATTSGNSNREKAREMFEAGKDRRAIADELGLAYATVYAHTKDMQGAEGSRAGRPRVFVEVKVKGGKTVQMGRSEAMREDFTNGMTIGDIGRKYGVIYQVAYQAVKGLIDRSEG